MADLTITAANVVPGANASLDYGKSAGTITAGQPVYVDEATGKYLRCDANSATAAARRAKGIALTGSSANQPIVVQKAGDLTMGATLVPGTAYCVSNAGGICPQADLTAGDYVCALGFAESTTVLAVDIQFPGVLLA